MGNYLLGKYPLTMKRIVNFDMEISSNCCCYCTERKFSYSWWNLVKNKKNTWNSGNVLKKEIYKKIVMVINYHLRTQTIGPCISDKTCNKNDESLGLTYF